MRYLRFFLAIIAQLFISKNKMIETEKVGEREVFYAFQERHAGQFLSVICNGQVLTFSADNDCHLRISLLTAKIVRFRYAVRSYYPADFSYAIDPEFETESVVYEVKEDSEKVVILTQDLQIHVTKMKLLVHIFDKEGRLIVSDEKGFHWETNTLFGGEIVKMSKTAFVGEAFYGLGDKTTVQNLRGRRFENWGSDEFGFKAGSDPLYKNINLYYSFHQGKTYGLFFDNSFRTLYDMGKESKDIISFWAEGGEMDYYFLNGDDLLDSTAQFAKLTGVPELPPLWSLGYQQCKWSYYPEAKVHEIADKMREHQIPCDAIYLDIDYMDGFRCFTWDKERFPDPAGMVKKLKEKGFKTVAIIDPGIKIDPDYRVFREGLDQGYFCKRMDGAHLQGKVWPGECYFPDFTNPKVRAWWAGLFEDLIGNIGLAGIWNDMNEPAIFDVPSKTFPLDVRHNYDGHECSHRKAHNVYGMQMARATHEGIKRFAKTKRPFVITRSGFSGIQRYSSTWTGDNLASWDHLYLAHLQTIRLSISGVSFCGSDIGGFIDQPEGELYVRWVQLAVFHPFFRTHSSGDKGDQEPWSFGPKNTALARDAVRLRYRLLPYMYTCFYNHYKTGKPILRPVIFDTGEAEHCGADDIAFLGDHIIYCPIFHKNARSRMVQLPRGTWFDYENLEKLEGGKVQEIKAPLTKIPFFVREGAVIPTFPLMQYVGEKQVEIVTLKVYFKRGVEQSNFYSDANEGNDYKNGDFRLAKFLTEGSLSNFLVRQEVTGSFKASFTHYRLQINGLSASELNIQVDGEWLHEYSLVNGIIVEFNVKSDFEKIEINF